jgi:hypothetical protein
MNDKKKAYRSGTPINPTLFERLSIRSHPFKRLFSKTKLRGLTENPKADNTSEMRFDAETYI